jgi:uncharacterized protein (TIGR00369 family)
VSEFSIAELITSIKESGNCDLLMQAVPYTSWMGISASIVDGELIGKMTFSDKLVGNPSLPALHGGTLGALLESTAIFKVLWDAEPVVLPKTINITVEYLRSAKTRDTYARGIVTRHGRRVANVRVEAWQDDPERPVAIAYANFLVTDSGA